MTPHSLRLVHFRQYAIAVVVVRHHGEQARAAVLQCQTVPRVAVAVIIDVLLRVVAHERVEVRAQLLKSLLVGGVQRVDGQLRADNVRHVAVIIHLCRVAAVHVEVALTHDGESQKLHVLKVVRQAVAQLVLHLVDHTLALCGVSPVVAVAVVVERVLQLPCLQPCILEVRVAVVLHGPRRLAQRVGCIGTHQDVELMTRRTYHHHARVLVGCRTDGRHVVGDAVILARQQRAAVAQGLQRGVSDADCLINLVGDGIEQSLSLRTVLRQVVILFIHNLFPFSFFYSLFHFLVIMPAVRGAPFRRCREASLRLHEAPSYPSAASP